MKPTLPLQRAIRRLPLTTKQGPHNYYKGNQTGAMGRHTKWGGYIIDWSKVRTYVMPDMGSFKLTPFVARNVKKDRHEPKGRKARQRRKDSDPGHLPNFKDGKAYLQWWKNEGGLN